VAWLLPVGGRTGFTQRETFGLDAGLTLLAWYTVIVVASLAGFLIANRYLRTPIALFEHIPDETFYRVVTLIAAIGVGLSYASIIIDDPDLVLRTIRDQQVNDVKRALYGDYQVGLYTLRYVSALGGGIAAFRILSRRRIVAWDVLNLISLGLAAFAAARLLIIVAALLVVALFYHADCARRLSLPHLAGAAFLLFLLLTPLNYVRNAGFYRDRFDEHNPIMMNLSEIRAYIGSPFQVSVGVAEKDLSEGNSLSEKLSRLTDFLKPSYFENPQPFSPYYRDKVDIERTLSTNSAFVDMYGALGLLAIPLIGFLCFSGAVAVVHLFHYRSYAFISGAVLLYVFAELWRISLFDQGIIHALFLVPLSIAGAYGLIQRWRHSRV
jgi:hypothetical protein